ncbi:MAG: hypothetical protein J4203_00640 [Candidatus Diapherotrites archaeon]|uniref:AbrB/MazE/SpoVT family DNA-binding domain-containing protein n=1 Tax=Candidatus Iainarchaeum sp. TaxID=3101447 RepID=A0A8T4L4X5_9ARCH|nr:hypothetical protein [Candidatus Diapherotrites archaeon]
MSQMFKAKIRRVGTSLGLLIPKDVVVEEDIQEGEQVDVGLLKAKRLESINKLFGIAKGARSFKRDKSNRVDRY